MLNMVLPFTDEWVDGLQGKTLIMARNDLNSVFYTPIKKIQIGSGGDLVGGGLVEIADGRLRFVGPNSVWGEFNGWEVGGSSSIYMVGYQVWGDPNRVVLFESKLLPSFGVVISSHVDFEEKTVQRLAQSLILAGMVDTSRVVVVVGGAARRDGEVVQKYGVTVVYSASDTSGFVGLNVFEMSQFKGVERWLLLHDTCEVEKDFLEKTKDVEIGLNPDVILLRPMSEKSEMGFYSTTFLEKVSVVLREKPRMSLFDHVIAESNLVMEIGGETKILGERDIYGQGNKRTILKLPIGVRKFQGKSHRGSKA